MVNLILTPTFNLHALQRPIKHYLKKCPYMPIRQSTATFERGEQWRFFLG